MENERVIYFAGGCFWGVEEYFSRIPGVRDVSSGYANGAKENPCYEEVCAGKTGHVETVCVRYDPGAVSLKILAGQFFKMIDPESVSKRQYINAMYYADDEDLTALKAAMGEVQKNYKKPLPVELSPLECFYPAEEYHQDYMKKNPGAHCHVSFDSLKDLRDSTA